jgi:hypothetical protein
MTVSLPSADEISQMSDEEFSARFLSTRELKRQLSDRLGALEIRVEALERIVFRFQMEGSASPAP